MPATRTTSKTLSPRDIVRDDYPWGFHDKEASYLFEAPRGLSKKIVRAISRHKKEPRWMTDFRLRALEVFLQKEMPSWGPDLSGLDFDDIVYYATATDRASRDWKDVPAYIRRTFDKLGIPQAEQKYLAGVGAQYDSEVVYHKIREDLEKQDVVFLSCDEGLKKHPRFFRKYFGTVVPPEDNKFAALNSAVWSGGSFVYVPEDTRVDIPLQAYFRINAQNVGQFERTLIIAAPNSFVHYVEGCTAPVFSSASLHSAVVELVALEGARLRYTTIQNWSKNVYNLVTKRAHARRDAVVEWVDGNLGSQVTMKYPSVYLLEEGAHGEILSVAFAGKKQHIDAGGKCVHLAPHTTSRIVSKSVSKDGGRTTYRGLLHVAPHARDVKSNVVCDALILDPASASDTVPYMEIQNRRVQIGHEASVGRVSEEQLFYLQSRGLEEHEAMALIVRGFVEPIVKQLPMEYAVELNRLIELQMEGSVG